MTKKEESNIIDGKKLAKEQEIYLAEQISKRISAGYRAPKLAVIIVGEDAASQIYVQKKQQACKRVGIDSQTFAMATDTSEVKLIDTIKNINNDSEIDGILVQLPLPKHIDTNLVIETIDPAKDVDGFHAYNIGKLTQGKPKLRPCTPYGIINALNSYDVKLKGMRAVIVGSSNIVGRPVAIELLNQGCTVTICNSSTKNLQSHLKEAELVIVAIGVPEFIKADWLKEDVIAIDVGINRKEDGSIVGDLEKKAKEKAKLITPVPGGVGPLTVVTLLQNTLAANLILNK